MNHTTELPRLKDILPHLSKVKRVSDGNYVACCVTHDDKNPSMSLKETSDGKLLVKCFADCDGTEILRELIRRAGFTPNNNPHSNGNGSHKRQNKIVSKDVYVYRDEVSQPLYENVIARYEDGTKQCYWRNSTTGNPGRTGVKKLVSYNLPRLIKGLGAGSELLMAEGEKCSDAVTTLGFVATNFKEWQSEYDHLLKDVRVVVLMDHDKIGEKLARKFAESIRGKCASLKMWDPFASDLLNDETMPQNGGPDIYDYIELRRAVEKGSEYTYELTTEAIVEELSVVFDNLPEYEPPLPMTAAETDFDLDDGELDEDEFIDNFPEPSPDCFYGLAGEFVQKIEQFGESHLMALLIQFLVYYGNMIGRSAHLQIGATQHHANLYCVLCGPTSSGRKGTSFDFVRLAFKGLDEIHDAESHMSGVGSGEAIIYKVRDPQYSKIKPKKQTAANAFVQELELTDAGAEDKRLLIRESEFGQILTASNREGSTIKSFLRNFYDHGDQKNSVKNSPLKTTGAHVSLIGHVTAEELLDQSDKTSTLDGTYNRILWTAVRRVRFMPLPEMPLESLLNELRIRLHSAIEFGKAARLVTLSEAAKNYWRPKYRELESPRPGIAGKVTSRAAANVMRLALIFALLDSKDEISREHLKAALAVWDYCSQSARYIFGNSTGNLYADVLLEALTKAENGLTRTQINVDVFGNNRSLGEIKYVLDFLSKYGLARCEKVRMPDSKKPREYWYAN